MENIVAFPRDLISLIAYNKTGGIHQTARVQQFVWERRVRRTKQENQNNYNIAR